MAFYVDAKAGLQINRVSFDGDADSESALTFSFGPGVAYFISDDVSIDTGLNFNRIGGDFDQSSINLNIGLQVFFTGKE
jgi:opacity protein-like surface antigen